MAQFIMQPQFRNPWVQNLPNMLQNMTLQTMAQKFRGKQLEEDRKTRDLELKESRIFHRDILQEGRQHAAGELSEKRDYALKTTPEWVETPHERVPAGSKAVQDSKGKWYVHKPKTTGEWEQLKPVNYGGALIYPQRNTKTKEIKFNRFPPSPRAGKGAGGPGGVGTPETARQINALTTQMTSILKKHNVGKVDFLTLTSLPAKDRRAWLEKQTKPVLARIGSKRDRMLYRQSMERLSELVSVQAGGLPKLVPGTTDEADFYMNESGGNLEKARELALNDGIILE
jgi:hypothetical protein